MLQSPCSSSWNFGADDGTRSSSKRTGNEPEDSLGAGDSKGPYRSCMNLHMFHTRRGVLPASSIEPGRISAGGLASPMTKDARQSLSTSAR